MKKTGLLAITMMMLAGCASQGGNSAQDSSVTRYMCNKVTAVADVQNGTQAPSEQTYPCTQEEFESMNKVYDSLDALKKSL